MFSVRKFNIEMSLIIQVSHLAVNLNIQELTTSLGIQALSYGEHERLNTSLIKNTMEMKIFCREGAAKLYYNCNFHGLFLKF